MSQWAPWPSCDNHTIIRRFDLIPCAVSDILIGVDPCRPTHHTVNPAYPSSTSSITDDVSLVRNPPYIWQVRMREPVHRDRQEMFGLDKFSCVGEMMKMISVLSRDSYCRTSWDRVLFDLRGDCTSSKEHLLPVQLALVLQEKRGFVNGIPIPGASHTKRQE